MKALLIGGLLYAALAPSALAQTTSPDDGTVKAFFRLYDSGNGAAKILLENAVMGADSAFGFSNAELKAQGRRPLYCQPGRLGLTPGQIINMVRERAKDENISDIPMPLAMLEVFKRTFPCDSLGE